MSKVWSVEQPEWTCKIDEGSAGLISVCWSPDSRHILTTADFHVCKNYCSNSFWGCELNIGDPVIGRKTDDRFTNAVTNIRKFID